jgi:hypothetical protein
MSIQKKSLIGNLKTAQKAIVAAIDATKPMRPVAGEPRLTTAKAGKNLATAKGRNLAMAKHTNLAMAKKGVDLAMAKNANFITAKR